MRPSGRPDRYIGWPPFLASSPLLQVTHAGTCVEQARVDGRPKGDAVVYYWRLMQARAFSESD